jgi:hypothetical protein
MKYKETGKEESGWDGIERNNKGRRRREKGGRYLSSL